MRNPGLDGTTALRLDESGINRMALWAMPLGQILLGKSLNPFLLPVLDFRAAGEREYLAEHSR